MTFFSNPLYLSCLLRWAHDIDAAYANDRIIGVGNSPAALTIAIDEIRRDRGQIDTVSCLGFTQYYYLNHRDRGYLLARDMQPDPQMIADYAAYMKSEGVTADNIVTDWHEKGLKTVFMDIVIQGCGLVSFYDTVAQTSSDYRGFMTAGAVRLCALMPRMSAQYTEQADIKIKTMRGDFTVTVDECRLETRNDTEDMLSTFLMGRSGHTEGENGRFVPSYPMSLRYRDMSHPHPVNPSTTKSFRNALRQHMEREKNNGVARGNDKFWFGKTPRP